MRTPSTRPRPLAEPRHLAALVVILLLMVGPVSSIDAQTPPAPATASGHHHGDHAPADEAASPTAAERAAAEALVRDTTTGSARFADVAVARAEGYAQATPFWFDDIPVAHFVSPAAVADESTLDPSLPESLIYLRRADGGLALLGVMYAAPIGTGPAVGGPLTPWHAHPELCINRVGIVPVLLSGRCIPSTVPLPAEMLHVWVVPNTLGPFGHLLSAADAAAATDQTPDELRPLPLVNEARLRGVIGRTLGLTPAELADGVGSGRSLAEMATAGGIARDTLLHAIDRTIEEDLSAASAANQIPADVGALIVRYLAAQIRLFVDHRGIDEPAVPVTTEFGYPCVTVSCLLPPA